MRPAAVAPLLAAFCCLSLDACTASANAREKPPLAPAPRDAVRGVVEVATGYAYAGCVRLESGAVECWGDAASRREAGEGRREPGPGPLPVAQLQATQLFASVHRHCAVTKGGALFCFSDSSPPTRLPFPDVVQASAGSDHVCALTRAGEVFCHGSEMNGALGFRPLPRWTGPRSWPDFGPKRVPGIAQAKQVAAGGNGTCAVLADGGLVCFGVHPFRAPHTDEPSAVQATSVNRVSGLPPVERVAIAGDMGCVLTKDRRVLCVRRNGGEKPFTPVTLEPREVMQRAISLDVTSETACVVTSEGEVWCWGAGPSGYAIEQDEAVRRGKSYERPAWRVEGVTSAVQVSQAGTHSCAVTREKTVLCWGTNAQGERGDGTLVAADGPTFLVRHTQQHLRGPAEGTFGCKRTDALERRCAAISTTCTLEPPPGYWRWGSRGGARCTDECLQAAQRELYARAIPPCLCSCEEEYQRAQNVEQLKVKEPPPP